MVLGIPLRSPYFGRFVQRRVRGVENCSFAGDYGYGVRRGVERISLWSIGLFYPVTSRREFDFVRLAVFLDEEIVSRPGTLRTCLVAPYAIAGLLERVVAVMICNVGKRGGLMEFDLSSDNGRPEYISYCLRRGQQG